MLKMKKNKQSSSMEDDKEVFFDKTDHQISKILLELSNPVVFSSNSTFLVKWGRTKKRYASVFLNPSKISPEPVVKSQVGEIGYTSSSSCLTGEAKKTVETGLISTQVGLLAQPITSGQNIPHLQPLIYPNRTANIRDVETALYLQQARENLERGFDLNLPATEEGNRIDFQRMAAKVQAAAQARHRRFGIIKSKKLFNNRFISPYQFN